jgi:hypothetical protein
LENSAASLFSSLGVTGNTNNLLASMLQTMQKSLQGASVSGNIVNTTA